MQYRVQNSVYRDFRHPTWTYHKVFEKCPKNAGKIRGKIIFPTFCCSIKKLDHNLGLHANNQRDKLIKSEGFFGLYEGENTGNGGML